MELSLPWELFCSKAYGISTGLVPKHWKLHSPSQTVLSSPCFNALITNTLGCTMTPIRRRFGRGNSRFAASWLTKCWKHVLSQFRATGEPCTSILISSPPTVALSSQCRLLILRSHSPVPLPSSSLWHSLLLPKSQVHIRCTTTVHPQF